MKVIDYVVITDSDILSFAEAILKYTNKGWDLQGGVSSYRHIEYHGDGTIYDNYPMYSQALVKFEKE